MVSQRCNATSSLREPNPTSHVRPHSHISYYLHRMNHFHSRKRLLQPIGTKLVGNSKYLPCSRLLIDTILCCLSSEPERLSATQSTLSIYAQMASSRPTLALYSFEQFGLPNVKPSGQPLLGNPALVNPPPNLQITGVSGSFNPRGLDLTGPSHANPALLLPSEPKRPPKVEMKDYPYLAIPDSPVWLWL